MMIEDAELRDIFKTASAEHLHNLENGLMFLEKNPNDVGKLEDLLREAHTLKGDSRMLGVNDVETITHQIEDILGAVKRGEKALSGQVCDRIYQALDAMRKLVHEAVTGESAGVNLFYVLAQLMGANSEPVNEEDFASEIDNNNSLFDEPIVQPTQDFSFDSFISQEGEENNLFNHSDSLFPTITSQIPPVPREQRQPEPLAVPKPPIQPVKEPEVSEQPLANNYQIDTIRVEPEKLDNLMNQAGELAVTKLRIARRMTEIEEILALWEEWSRDTYLNRLAIDEVEKQSHHGSIKQVQKFHHLSEQRIERLGTLVNSLKSTAYEDTARLEVVANELESGIRTLRLLPLSTIFNLFPRMVRDLAKQQGKEINLVIEGGDTKADKRILEEMKDPLMHILRNAIDHGIETPQERQAMGKPQVATIRIKGYQKANTIGIEVTEDGRGLNLDSIKRTALRRGICREEELAVMTTNQIQSLIFAPGFSTRTNITELSGRGVGLDVVRANVERLKGTIKVESTPNQGCAFLIKLDTTLATTHVLIAEVNRTSYAIPVEFVQQSLLLSREEIFAIEGSQTIVLDGQPVSVAWLADLLELRLSAPGSLPAATSTTKAIPCIILQIGSDRLGLLVDALLDEQDVVLKAQSKLLKRLRNVSGATILGTGEVCMVLNPLDLLKSLQKRSSSMSSNVSYSKIDIVNTKQAILLVEDSLTIRTQMKRILEGAGYEVVAAIDGSDGFNKLKTRDFDAVVSDVQMPNLDGLALTARIRQYKEYSELPIVLVTTLATDEDKTRGAEAGANAYLTKGTFDQKVLLETLRRLI